MLTRHAKVHPFLENPKSLDKENESIINIPTMQSFYHQISKYGWLLVLTLLSHLHAHNENLFSAQELAKVLERYKSHKVEQLELRRPAPKMVIDDASHKCLAAVLWEREWPAYHVSKMCNELFCYAVAKCLNLDDLIAMIAELPLENGQKLLVRKFINFMDLTQPLTPNALHFIANYQSNLTLLLTKGRGAIIFGDLHNFFNEEEEIFQEIIRRLSVDATQMCWLFAFLTNQQDFNTTNCALILNSEGNIYPILFDFEHSLDTQFRNSRGSFQVLNQILGKPLSEVNIGKIEYIIAHKVEISTLNHLLFSEGQKTVVIRRIEALEEFYTRYRDKESSLTIENLYRFCNEELY